MARPSRSAPQTKSLTAHVLLQHFPRHVHQAMKSAAVLRGVCIAEVYTAACEMFLGKQAKRKRS